MNRVTLTLLVLLLLLVGCASTPTTATEAPTTGDEPTAAVEPTMVVEPTAEVVEPTTPAAPTFSEGGVSLTFDPAVADSAALEVVPAAPLDEELPIWERQPEHRRITFAGYESQNTYHEPAIRIYPVDAFAAASPEAGTAIEALNMLLGERPGAPELIPLLPFFNATQMTRAQVRYLEFEGGTGVRFVTQYAQAALPINNQEIFYTFQGLTSDGRYIVSAILPVAVPGIAATDDVRAAEEGIVPFPIDALQSGEDPAATLDAYVAAVTERLDAADPAAFTPSLTLLDAMIESLRVE